MGSTTPPRSHAPVGAMFARRAGPMVRGRPMTRAATVTRTTRETSITVTVDLDGQGLADVQTPIPFLSHMVDQLARHGAST